MCKPCQCFPSIEVSEDMFLKKKLLQNHTWEVKGYEKN